MDYNTDARMKPTLMQSNNLQQGTKAIQGGKNFQSDATIIRYS